MAERENMVYWKQNPKGGKHIMAKTLHPNQIHAISHGAGPMLVLAGPGSGKTTVIIQRIRRLTEKMGVSPYRILVITFTKAAAEQMKTRYAALQGKSGVMFGTFHSIFFRILRQACGYSLEQVLSEDERRNTLQKLVTEARISVQDQEEYIQQFFSQYSLMKNQLLDVSDFMPDGLPKDEFVALTKKFDGWKRRNEKIDFDDMLTECYDVLSQDEKVRKAWQDRFDYILVDEFQDVNRAQYACKCWRHRKIICLWWEMTTRAFMASVVQARPLCWISQKIFRERKKFFWM